MPREDDRTAIPSQTDRALLAILRELILIKKVGFILIVMLGLALGLVVLAIVLIR